MSFFRILLLALLISLSAAALSGPAGWSQEEGSFLSFETQGAGSIKAGNLAQARRDAIQDALRGAVIQAVAGMLTESETKNAAKILGEAVYKDAERYVQTYRITGEYPGYGAYKVALRATVATEELARDLRVLGLLKEQTGSMPTAEVVVAVRGLRNYGDYVKFKELLESRPKGLLRVQPHLVAWRQAEFTVTLKGTAQSLAGDLAKTGQFIPERIDIGRGRIEGIISGKEIR